MVFEAIDRYGYTHDQKLIANFVDRLAQRYDRRYWLGKAQKKQFPQEMWDEIAKNGYFGMTIPKEYGGSGLSFSDLRIFLEELARAGLATLHFVSFFMDTVMLLHGNEALKNKYLPMMAGGTYFSFALTEPDSGTNTLNIRTRAMRDGDHYRVNGQKVFISGGDESEYMVLVARTQAFNSESKEARKEGISLFVVDSHSDGITMQPQEIDIVAPERQYTVFLDDVRVPAGNLIGDESSGFSYLLSGLNLERIIVSSLALGMGKLLLEKAVQYAGERNIFGDPIGSYQGVQHPLSRAFIQLQLAGLASQRASEAMDSGEDRVKTGMYANIAKIATSEAAFCACDAAIQIHGGYGLVKEYDVINFANAVRLFRIAPVNNEMILNYIGEHFLKLPRSY